MERTLPATLALFMLLLTLVPAPASGQQSAEYTEPEICLAFDQDTFYSTLEPDVVLYVEVTGTITCKMPDMAPDSLRCYVYVFFESTTWTPSETIQYIFPMDKGVAHFDCTFTPNFPIVPAGEVINISVRAIWNYPATRQGGDVDPVYSSIEVTPYGRVLIEPFDLDDPSTVKVGKRLEGRLEICNRGNDDDVITLEVVSAPPGVEVIFDDQTLEMELWERRLINITILQEIGDAREGEIVIRARCANPGTINSREMTLGITVEEKDEGWGQNGLVILLGIMIGALLAAVILIRKKIKKR